MNNRSSSTDSIASKTRLKIDINLKEKKAMAELTQNKQIFLFDCSLFSEGTFTNYVTLNLPV